MKSEVDASREPGDAYRYRNVRPLQTFGFAFLAAMGALGLIAAAHGALAKATEDQVIACPPDLRDVLAEVGSRTGVRIRGVADAAEADGNTHAGPAGSGRS